ncbi:MAG TPA: hypothetical protein VJL29_01970, partial [Thermoguttaceae bacterium]|nr:hypothetical protein [Thermoguttaceae bacterium]
MSSRKHKSKDRNESRASSGATQIDASVAAADGSSPAVRRQNDPRPWFLAVVTALFVARPMLPSESIAQSGEGTMLVMLSLLLLAVWSIYLLRSGGRALRFGPADAAVLVLLLLHTASALWATKTGNARAALNVLWAWVGMGVGFFLLRQLVRTAREARAIVAVMIALGVALAGYGLYQYAVEIPEMQRDFARDAEGMMRSEGLWYEPGSVAREQFDQRLKSHEPYATFALTNSLAGYLAPWLAVAVGLALFSGTNPSRDREGAVGE